MRLIELEQDLRARRGRAQHEGRTGEIEGVDLTLRLLEEKKAAATRAAQIASAPVPLGIPSTAPDAQHARSPGNRPR